MKSRRAPHQAEGGAATTATEAAGGGNSGRRQQQPASRNSLAASQPEFLGQPARTGFLASQQPTNMDPDRFWKLRWGWQRRRGRQGGRWRIICTRIADKGHLPEHRASAGKRKGGGSDTEEEEQDAEQAAADTTDHSAHPAGHSAAGGGARAAADDPGPRPSTVGSRFQAQQRCAGRTTQLMRRQAAARVTTDPADRSPGTSHIEQRCGNGEGCNRRAEDVPYCEECLDHWCK